MRKSTFFSFLCLGLSLSVGSALANGAMSGQDLDVSAQHLSSAVSGRDMSLDDVTVEGRLTVGRNLSCQRCSVAGNISVGHDLQLAQCEQVNGIASGHDADVSGTTVRSTMAVGNNLSLQQSTLEAGAHVGNQVMATNSTVKGPLVLQGNWMKLDHSTTGAVTFAKPAEVLVNETIAGTINSSVVVQHGSSASVHVGPNSLTSLNGYTVKGAANQTTLITPEQAIYVNGVKVSGEGPKTYAEYRNAHTGAPTIQGPGWTDAPPHSADKRNATLHAAQTHTLVNTIELTNQSRIEGDVVFESGTGRVILHPGSEVNGKIVNGRIERVSN